MPQQQEPSPYIPQTGQQNFSGYVNPGQYAQYGVAPPGNNIGMGSPLNGQAGYVGGRFGAALSGAQGGFNFSQQVTEASRANKDYQQTQATQRTMQRANLEKALSTPDPDPTDPMYRQRMQDKSDAQKQLNQLNQPQGFGGFLQTLGTGVQKLGHAVAPSMISAPGGQGAIPAAPAPQAPMQQGALPTGAYAAGGPVTAFSPSSTPQPATPAGYADGGPIPPQAAPQGGALPGPAAAAPPPQGAPAAGPPPPQGAAPQAPVGMPGNPYPSGDPTQALPAQAADPSGPFNKFYQGLLDASLNDKGEPAGREPVPSAIANPNVAIQSTANNPAAARGIPEDSPEESDTPTHSLSSGWYEHQDFLALQAASSAAAAGHDPQAVYAAMTNMTTSFLQSHIMREASAAAVAVQAGDMPAVEKALKNMYYYVPDGNELQTKKVGGQLMYQNPIFPYLDKNGQPTSQGGPGATPNMQPVDAQHVSFLARAAADPMEIGSLIQNARIASQEAATKNLTAQASMVAAQGTLARGTGIQMDAATREKLAPSQIFGNISKGDYYSQAIQARINATGGKSDPVAAKAGQEAAGMVYNMAQGQPTTLPAMVPVVRNGQPVMGPDGKPAMEPSMAPNAGHTIRDPSKVPSFLAGKSPDQLANISSLAGEIAAANKGQMPSTAAVQLAGTIYGHQGQTHKDPASGKPTADVKFSPDHTQGWVWTGASWQNFRLHPQTGGNLAAGEVDNIAPYPEDSTQGSNPGDNPMDPDPNESNGSGAIPAQQPDDNRPAE